MSDKLPRVDCQELIHARERAGFAKKRQKGSHLHMWRESDKKRITVPVHPSKTLPTGTLRGILRDADISIEEFRNLL